MKKILIIDDDKGVQISLLNVFKYKNYQAVAMSTAKEGLEELKKNFYDVVILDIRLPDKSGLECLKEIKEIDETISVIILTAFGDTKQAVEAIKLGAFDYLTKPIANEELIISIEKALKEKMLKKELYYLREKTNIPHKDFIFKSEKMQGIVKEALEIAKTDYSVLIIGETGVGKEVLASFIHRNSSRSEGPFIVIDCGTLPESLIESELFGHEKGAFTGADKKYIGKIELADNGTLFLDEITNLPLNLQTKFLRFIEQKKFYRVGGSSLIEVNIRFITATNVALEDIINSEKFRKDLFYRINEYKIIIPPLRERKDDIIPLAKHFIEKTNLEMNKSIIGLSKQAEEMLLNYDWPGNIRELYNVIKATSFFATELIEEKHLSKILHNPQKIDFSYQSLNLNSNIESIEKNLIRFVLEKNNYNKQKAARILGISRRTLYKKIKQYSLEKVKKENTD